VIRGTQEGWLRRLNTSTCRRLKKLSGKAEGESKPEAYPQGYVEDFDEPRTKLGSFFSLLTKKRPALVWNAKPAFRPE